MEWIDIKEDKRDEYNNVVDHPLQSFEWGEFRRKTGVKVIRRALIENKKLKTGFTLTVHKIPKTNFNIGYLPKGILPSKEMLSELSRIGKEQKCVFIQLEPNVKKSSQNTAIDPLLIKSHHPLFTKYTFILDITKNEDELLKVFHPKTRYNIKVAQKHGVKVFLDNSKKGFDEYLRLTKETTTRQKFFAHTSSYHKAMWETLETKSIEPKFQNSLTAHLLTATYQPDGRTEKTLASWILFVFHDTLYYPYGASSSEFRNVMASNLIMWEAIKLGKKLGLKKFDMWGALGPNPNPNDPWYGFHKFKQGYSPVHTEFIGSFDLVIKPKAYKVYRVVDRARWALLRVKKATGL